MRSSPFPFSFGGVHGLDEGCKLLFHHGYLWCDEQPTKSDEGRKRLVYFPDRGRVEELCQMLECEPNEPNWHPATTVFPIFRWNAYWRPMTCGSQRKWRLGETVSPCQS